ncbi:MAG: iron-sulfur cluster assembly protein [Chloroflexota bacterium]
MRTSSVLESHLLDMLKDVEDPEIPVSIVDLGLVVDLSEQSGVVDIKLTLTSMGCPAADMIMDDIRTTLLKDRHIHNVNIEIVWDPIWTKSRLTEDGKAALREWGIAV